MYINAKFDVELVNKLLSTHYILLLFNKIVSINDSYLAAYLSIR